MPLKLLNEEREIEHKGITFISKLPNAVIPEVYKILIREHLLMHEVSYTTLEIKEPYFFELEGRRLIAFIAMSIVRISEMPQEAEF